MLISPISNNGKLDSGRNYEKMCDKIFSRLKSPPNTIIEQMPVITSYSDLPFEELSWENFEKYCYQLGSLSMTCIDASYIYGRRGQKQDGIDLYFNVNGEINVWQIKRYQEFTSNDITDAVSKFNTGKWADKVNKFVLCVSNCLNDTGIVDTIHAQTEILKNKNIEFAVYNSTILTQLSLKHLHIISMFFGKHWVDALSLNNQIANEKVKEVWVNSETGTAIDNGELFEVGNTKAVIIDDVIMGEVKMPDGKKIYAEFDAKTGGLIRNPSPYSISEYKVCIPEDLVLDCKKGNTTLDNIEYYAEIYAFKFGGEAHLIYEIATKRLAFNPYIKAPVGMTVFRNDSDRCFLIIKKAEWTPFS
ncbi:MAG: hypothetical protein PHQ92_10740 [Petrimonas sp.]|nr:hypothetical protein [Petrimonas sp.]